MLSDHSQRGEYGGAAAAALVTGAGQETGRCTEQLPHGKWELRCQKKGRGASAPTPASATSQDSQSVCARRPLGLAIGRHCWLGRAAWRQGTGPGAAASTL